MIELINNNNVYDRIVNWTDPNKIMVRVTSADGLNPALISISLEKEGDALSIIVIDSSERELAIAARNTKVVIY